MIFEEVMKSVGFHVIIWLGKLGLLNQTYLDLNRAKMTSLPYSFRQEFTFQSLSFFICKLELLMS